MDKDIFLKIFNIIVLMCDLDKIIFNFGVCILVIVNILYLLVYIYYEIVIDRNKWFNNINCDIVFMIF